MYKLIPLKADLITRVFCPSLVSIRAIRSVPKSILIPQQFPGQFDRIDNPIPSRENMYKLIPLKADLPTRV